MARRIWFSLSPSLNLWLNSFGMKKTVKSNQVGHRQLFVGPVERDIQFFILFISRTLKWFRKYQLYDLHDDAAMHQRDSILSNLFWPRFLK